MQHSEAEAEGKREAESESEGRSGRKRVEIVWGISFTKLNLFCQRCKRPKGAMSASQAPQALCVCVCERQCVCVCGAISINKCTL